MSIDKTLVKEPVFYKVLAKYYIKWFQDCHDSAIYCREHNKPKLAERYLNDASGYLTIIMENWEAIEYFSVGDRAFLHDSALLPEYRGYE